MHKRNSWFQRSSVTVILWTTISILAIIGIAACVSEKPADTPLEIAIEPDALAVNDGIHRGVYKGVLTTATGSGKLRLNIQNNVDEIRLDGSFKGAAFRLQGTEEILPDDAGFRYSFAGESDGSEAAIRFQTEISLNGAIDAANTAFTAGSEQVHVNMFKESSTELIKVFEGSYGGNSAGNWNFILRGDEISGYYAGDGEDEFYGRLTDPDNGDDGARIRVWGSAGTMVAAGRISREDLASGTWIFDENQEYGPGTQESDYPTENGENQNRWKGERTL